MKSHAITNGISLQIYGEQTTNKLIIFAFSLIVSWSEEKFRVDSGTEIITLFEKWAADGLLRAGWKNSIHGAYVRFLENTLIHFRGFNVLAHSLSRIFTMFQLFAKLGEFGRTTNDEGFLDILSYCECFPDNKYWLTQKLCHCLKKK